jgi:hypothetical protein
LAKIGFASDSLCSIQKIQRSPIEGGTGLKIDCIEEIAYSMGYINATELENLRKPIITSEDGRYLMRVLELGG